MRGSRRLISIFIPMMLGLALVVPVTGCHPRVPQPLLSLQGKALPERHLAPTDDGWSLALFHYPAWFRTPTVQRSADRADTGAGTPLPLSRDPVILCHGLAANHYSWDLTEERSLARYLADRGYDVWILDLRGHGDSRPTRGVKRERDRDGWGFDEYALHDVPAAISYVRQATGASQVNWVGHSMGGMIIYAWLASSGATTVRNVVAIGSPGSLDFANDLIQLSLGGMRFIQWAPRVGARRGARLWSHIGGRIIGGFEETIWHLDNMAPEAARLMFWEGVENIERGVERSFAAIGESGKLVSRDRKTDYQASLPRFSAPLLAIAGKLDGLATPFAVQRLFDLVGSRDKTYELISRANGYSVDYGHVDLIIGDQAQRDVYPLVYRWLENRQPSAAQVAAGGESGGDAREGQPHGEDSHEEGSRGESSSGRGTRGESTGETPQK